MVCSCDQWCIFLTRVRNNSHRYFSQQYLLHVRFLSQRTEICCMQACFPYHLAEKEYHDVLSCLLQFSLKTLILLNMDLAAGFRCPATHCACLLPLVVCSDNQRRNGNDRYVHVASSTRSESHDIHRKASCTVLPWPCQAARVPPASNCCA